MNLRKSLFLMLVVVFAFTFMSTSSFAEEARYGGTLTVGGEYPIVTFDSHTLTGEPTWLRSMVLEGLVRWGAGHEPLPQLAESWEPSEDGLEWTFNIRENVKFHDGSDLTAHDVAASFERFLNVTVKSGDFEPVSDWEATDDNTFVVYLDEPYQLPEMLAPLPGAFVVYPEHIVAEFPNEQISDELNNIIGTGPYTLEEWRAEEFARLVRFDDYYSTDVEFSMVAGHQEAYLDEIVYRLIPDAQSRLAAVMSNEIDLAINIPLDNFDRVDNTDNVEPVIATRGDRVYFKLNSDVGVFSDPILRKAARASLNLTNIMTVQGPSDLWNVNTAVRFQPDQTEVWRSQSDYFPEDMELAQYLIEHSDYDGEPVRMLVSPGRVTGYNAALQVQNQLAEAGFNVELASYDTASFREVRTNLDAWDMKPARGGSDQPIDYAANASRTNRNGEPWAWVTPEYDYWVNIARTAVDQDRRAKAIDNVFRLHAEGAGEFWIGEVYPMHVRGSHVMNVPSWMRVMLGNVWLED